MLGYEAGIALPVRPLHRFRCSIGHRPTRAPAQPPVERTILPVLLEAATPTAERPFAHPQKLRHFQNGSAPMIPNGSAHPSASTSSVPAAAPSVASQTPIGSTATGEIICYLDRTTHVRPTLVRGSACAAPWPDYIPPRPAERFRRRGGRVVEGARLERVYTGNRIGGSNPPPSAR
jgi:hypothetical protein